MKFSPQDIVNNLNFSGDKDSWFDGWHTHIDWDGEGNHSWTIRQKYLSELFSLYKLICEKLKSYPNKYQVWVDIDENDSGQDAVYIHTQNPNANNFPIKLNWSDKPNFTNENLRDYLTKQNLTIIYLKTDEGNLYTLFDKNIGAPLN